MNKFPTFSPIEYGGGGEQMADAPSTRDDVSELPLGVGEGSLLALSGWHRDVGGLWCPLDDFGSRTSPSDNRWSSGTFGSMPSSLSKLCALLLSWSSGLWNGNETK